MLENIAVNLQAIIVWASIIKFKIYGLLGLKTWLLVVNFFGANGDLIQERYWVYDFDDCYRVAKPAAEALWKKHDQKGSVSFMCIDKKEKH